MIPYSDTEKIALLAELECGEKIIVPSSVEHAEFMIKVAQGYINQNKQKMLDILRS